MRSRRSTSGFTLIELLVVVGLIAGLTFFLVRGMSGGKGAALQSAQATMANLVTAARTKAMASGQSSRLLVQVDPISTARPIRFLRYVVVQVQTSGGWDTVTDAFLPDGIYVLPGNFASIPAGLFSTSTTIPWTKSDGTALRSTALRSNQIVAETINGTTSEQWVSITISSNPGTSQSGDLILGSGKIRSPGSYGSGDSPVELDNPENVRGLTLSAYAVPALVNSRGSF